MFNRARKFLRLEPWLSEVAILSLDKEHPDPLLENAEQSDFGEDDVEPDFEDAVRERLEEKEGEAWPQLLNLVSTISRDKSGMRQEEGEALYALGHSRVDDSDLVPSNVPLSLESLDPRPIFLNSLKP